MCPIYMSININLTNLDIDFKGINSLHLFRFPGKAVPKFSLLYLKLFFNSLLGFGKATVYQYITVSKIIIN